MYTIVYLHGQEPTVLLSEKLRPEVLADIRTFKKFKRIEEVSSLPKGWEEDYNVQFDDCDWYYTSAELAEM